MNFKPAQSIKRISCNYRLAPEVDAMIRELAEVYDAKISSVIEALVISAAPGLIEDGKKKNETA